MSASKLIRPIIDVQDSFIEALKEYHEEGRYLEKDIETINNDFDTYVEILHQNKGHPEKEFENWVEEVPQTVLWLVRDGEYYGTLNIRKRLNWHLERYGGNITFVIRPSKRGMGFGKKILQKGLPAAHALGLDKALLTIPTENQAAKRIVEYCNGTYEDTTTGTENFPSCFRYWIDCV
jgi:predicted acetyltransferase